MRIRSLQALFLTLSLLLATQANATIISLYDGAGLPAAQPWLNYADNSALAPGSVSQSSITGGVRLQTDAAVKAGYSNYTPAQTLKNAAFPILDRNTGFELSFRAALLNEGHSSNDRAGFSVILLSSDLYGIELGFWSSQIWAQADTPLFKHAESANTSTTSSQNYQLHVLGSQYTLLQSGNTVLSGSLRNYSAFSGPGGPYGLNNFLFLGDNTSSASADLLLGPVSLQTNLSSVPEPASLLFLAVAAAFCSGRMLRRTTRRPAEIFPANSG